MAAAPIAPVPPEAADPDRSPTAIPARIGALLGLLRKLTDRGKSLAVTLRQRRFDPRRIEPVEIAFGTADTGRILGSITRGLHRATALEARLLQRAATGRDLTTAPLRRRASRKPRGAEPAAARTTPAGGPELLRLPTPKEIAGAVRRRPVGAVIVDICYDLGILPGHLDRATWDDLVLAIVGYGGNLATYYKLVNQRCFAGLGTALHDDAAARSGIVRPGIVRPGIVRPGMALAPPAGTPDT